MNQANDVLGLVPEDGYTESAFILGVERIHPDLRFEYRPITLIESVAYSRAVKDLDGKELHEHSAKWAAGRLLSWDLRGKDGKTVPIQADMLTRLKPRLFYRMQAVLLGNEAPDIDPRLSAAKLEQEEKDRAAAAAAGKSLAEWRAERDQKN
ncbi:MAG: hypothetical protein JNM56_12890 [Planctomycetia bacterium]|nr:hypothetical protein [Planctomycetia bacterium]